MYAVPCTKHFICLGIWMAILLWTLAGFLICPSGWNILHTAYFVHVMCPISSIWHARFAPFPRGIRGCYPAMILRTRRAKPITRNAKPTELATKSSTAGCKSPGILITLLPSSSARIPLEPAPGPIPHRTFLVCSGPGVEFILWSWQMQLLY